ncbi:hypothetical protein GCM10008090_01350 [Arenicella chitinivorans]|uniref:Uncharacterized protein n=1 Tax=Arenicella chitinivorans TaxID=1329800 RepID=A0A918VGX8_9GAMM|nr:hypothetical protein [Arenicella chitinivorans]GGZ96838.1 hypothetical protein GCM10008090_01350 [Arenicella chitinivorans]
MSNPNVSVVEKNDKTYLVLNEWDGSGGIVNVTLTRGVEISSNPVVYAGVLMYGSTSIDVIEAHFSSGINNDNVQLAITLGDSGNYFTGNATDSDGAVLQYITQTMSKAPGASVNNLLTFTYTEPPAGTDIFKDVYFLTHLGTIDPGDEVDRDPH